MLDQRFLFKNEYNVMLKGAFNDNILLRVCGLSFHLQQ